jgi:redox-sensitive bicupin YhaK (pirin superfamily)
VDILQRDSLPGGGFAGVREHRLVMDPRVFGEDATGSLSWPGIGNFVYLADARFVPHGETGMHSHHEIDVISVMVDGRIAHRGSLGHGQDLMANDVQVQRAGGEGFSHNEVNPDDHRNRMIQLWVLQEQPGQPAAYRVYQPQKGQLTRVYGGASDTDSDFPARTCIDIAWLESGQSVSVTAPFIAYLCRGSGSANGKAVKDGDLMRGDRLQFDTGEAVQLIVVQLQE